jgi:hypothetical protein
MVSTPPQPPALDDDLAETPATRDRAAAAAVALAVVLAAAGGLITAGIATVSGSAGLIAGGVLLAAWALLVFRGVGAP